MSIPTYSAHENGGRAFSAEDATMYAKRFGVTLEWLLTGEGERNVNTTLAGAPVIATPIIGTLSNHTWTQRSEIDLDAEFPHHLEVAVLTGGPDIRWFAVHLPDVENLPEGSLPGDHLICRVASELQSNEYGIVDRSGFEGKLRQLITVQCSFQDGKHALLGRSDSSGLYEIPIEGDYRLLGKIEALYRSI